MEKEADKTKPTKVILQTLKKFQKIVGNPDGERS